MGNVIRFPVNHAKSSYVDGSKCTSTGKPLAKYHKKSGVPQNAFEEITEQFFASLLQRRQEVLRAKLKIKEFDMKRISQKYPGWNYEDIMDLKAQFQTFDINQDGLIDYEELKSVLDEIGDESPEELRKDLFKQMDEDGSGGIDFEEYLTLIHHITHGHSHTTSNTGISMDKNTLGVLKQEGTVNAQRVRKLSVVQQIQNGLF